MPISRELRLEVEKAAKAVKELCTENEVGPAWMRHKAEIDEASMARNRARLRTCDEDEDNDEDDDEDEQDDSSEHTEVPSSVAGSDDTTNDRNRLPSLDSSRPEPSPTRPKSQRTLTTN
ncbi:hypothetical protein CMEL01_06241 [Colletotrichum melonis]|uniref:Uncharacterized protein n=1 Tax=Colletotrichum melonis TaxID=1209925 RepID=A0AAI9U6V0_9PEZI|nr:hypothetical protein CMEL01_06241 [Colletotrichum melonis]